MHFVYVLQSESDGGGSYIGYTANLDRRLNEHIEGKSFATSFRGPWELIYYEAYRNREDAMGRERFLKSGSGRGYLKKQLARHLEMRPFREVESPDKR